MDTITVTPARLSRALLVVLAATLVPAFGQVPQPDLAGVEAALVEQINEAQALIEASRGQGPRAHGAAWGELGILYQAMEFDDDAIDCYDTAQHLDPFDGRWPYLKGMVLASRGETDAALQQFTASIALMPSQSTAAWTRMARVLLEAGRAGQALSASERALQHQTDSAAALAIQGEALLALDRAQEAIDALTAALQIEPRANRLRFPLAMAYRSLGETESMERELELAGQIGISPDDPVGTYLEEHARGSRILTLRARRAFEAGDMEVATALFERALGFAPDDADLWVNLGVTQARLGEVERAIESLNRALQFDPAQTTARINLAELLRTRDEFDAAWQVLAADEARLDRFDQRVLRARLGVQSGRLEAAADDYLAALDREKDLEVWRETIQTLLQLDRYDDIRTLATHPGLNEEGRAWVATLVESLLTSESAPLARLALADDLSQHLFEREKGLVQVRLRVRVLLAQHPDCRAALQWLTSQSERPDWGEDERQAIMRLSLDLARQSRCRARRP